MKKSVTYGASLMNAGKNPRIRTAAPSAATDLRKQSIIPLNLSGVVVVVGMVAADVSEIEHAFRQLAWPS